MKAEEFLKDGMDRIEFRNQLMELTIGTDDDAELIKLKTLSKNELNELQNILLNINKQEYSTWGKEIKYGMEKVFDEDYDELRKMFKNLDIPKKDNFNDK